MELWRPHDLEKSFKICLPGPFSSMLDICTGTPAFIGDGPCDPSNSNLSCNYDGGDCCECTCIDGPEYTCGSNGYDCVNAACTHPDVRSSYPECAGDSLLWGDGFCNEVNNNLDYGYDGGNCCIYSRIGFCTINIEDVCLKPSAGEELYGCEPPQHTVRPCSADDQRSWVVNGFTQAKGYRGSSELLWRRLQRQVGKRHSY